MVEIEPNQEKFIHKLFLDTYRSLYAYALAVLRDPQRAEELVQDVFLLLDAGIGTFSFLILLRYLLTAMTAFGGTVLGVKVMRYLAGLHGFDLFAFYCFGLSLFTFILNLLA